MILNRFKFYIGFLSFMVLFSCGQMEEYVVGANIWQTQNLASPVYQNGDTIPYIEDAALWGKTRTGAYTFYNHNDSLANIYGYLYNGYAVLDSRGLCPKGWHVANEQDWQNLISKHQGKELAALHLKSKKYWLHPHKKIYFENTFSALPGGNRKENGDFNGLGLSGTFWTATEVDSTHLLAYYMNTAHSKVGNNVGDKNNALSCRCVKD